MDNCRWFFCVCLLVCVKTAEYFREDEDAILVDTMGTSYYWSPGACDNSNRDAFADDVWALGVCLFALIYSILPYFDVQEHLVFEMIAKNAPIIPSNHHYTASEQVKDLLEKLLKHDEKKRMKLEDIKKHAWLKDYKWSNTENDNPINFPIPVETKDDDNDDDDDDNEENKDDNAKNPNDNNNDENENPNDVSNEVSDKNDGNEEDGDDKNGKSVNEKEDNDKS